MARQLPARLHDNRSLALPESSGTAISRLASAVAPDLIRIAERWASERVRQRDVREHVPQHATSGEAMFMSEVEVDVSAPFIRKVTMRRVAAWQTTPVTVDPPARDRRDGVMRRVGLIGATGLVAVAAGLLAKRAVTFSNGRPTIIDVPGRQRD